MGLSGGARGLKGRPKEEIWPGGRGPRGVKGRLKEECGPGGRGPWGKG